MVELTKAGATALRADPSQPSADTALAELVLHVDLATLARTDQDAEQDPRARGAYDEGPALHPDTLRRLTCDAELVAIIDGTDGYSVRGSGGEGFAFSRPDASPIPLCPPGPALVGAIDKHPASAGIGAGTILPDWYGDPLDLDYAMAVIFSQRHHRATLAAAP